MDFLLVFLRTYTRPSRWQLTSSICKNVRSLFAVVCRFQRLTAPNCPEASKPRDRTSLSENLRDSMSIVFSVHLYHLLSLGPPVSEENTYEFSQSPPGHAEAYPRPDLPPRPPARRIRVKTAVCASGQPIVKTFMSRDLKGKCWNYIREKKERIETRCASSAWMLEDGEEPAEGTWRRAGAFEGAISSRRNI